MYRRATYRGLLLFLLLLSLPTHPAPSTRHKSRDVKRRHRTGTASLLTNASRNDSAYTAYVAWATTCRWWFATNSCSSTQASCLPSCPPWPPMPCSLSSRLWHPMEIHRCARSSMRCIPTVRVSSNCSIGARYGRLTPGVFVASHVPRSAHHASDAVYRTVAII